MVNVLIECGTVDPKRNTGFKYFEKATGVKIEHREQIDNFKANHDLTRNLQNLARRLDLHGYQCMGLVRDSKFRNKNLHRPIQISITNFEIGIKRLVKNVSETEILILNFGKNMLLMYVDQKTSKT